MKPPIFVIPALLLASSAAAWFAAPLQAQPAPPLAGGYSKASPKDAAVMMAAKFAVDAKAKSVHQKIRLVSVQSAEKQVVAGMNYRSVLKVKMRGKAQMVRATVYQDLQGKYSLSEWMAVK